MVGKASLRNVDEKVGRDATLKDEQERVKEEAILEARQGGE